MSRRKIFIAASIALAAALALSACHKPAQETARQQARTVTVVEVAPRMLAGGLVASGQLIPREDTAIFPEITGYRVTQVFVDEGSWVKAGQPLAQMDDVLLQRPLDQQPPWRPSRRRLPTRPKPRPPGCAAPTPRACCRTSRSRPAASRPAQPGAIQCPGGPGA